MYARAKRWFLKDGTFPQLWNVKGEKLKDVDQWLNIHALYDCLFPSSFDIDNGYDILLVDGDGTIFFGDSRDWELFSKKK